MKDSELNKSEWTNEDWFIYNFEMFFTSASYPYKSEENGGKIWYEMEKSLRRIYKESQVNKEKEIKYDPAVEIPTLIMYCKQIHHFCEVTKKNDYHVNELSSPSIMESAERYCKSNYFIGNEEVYDQIFHNETKVENDTENQK